MTPPPTASSVVASVQASGRRQPPGLFLLFVVEMWERFSYYGMRALLVLYLVAGVQEITTGSGQKVSLVTDAKAAVVMKDGTQIEGQIGPIASSAQGTPDAMKQVMLAVKQPDGSTNNVPVVLADIQSATVTGEGNAGPGWTSASSNTLFGWYTGLVFLLPIAGGFIADRFIGTHRSMLVGGLLIASGHIALAISGINRMDLHPLGEAIFIGGLALIVLGTGHFKPCVTVMVGQLYTAEDPRRDGGFTIFYMGINVGAFLCAFVCGTLGEVWGWHWGFGSAAVGMLLGLGIYTLFRNRYLRGIGLPPENKPNTAPMFFLGSVAAAACVALIYYMGFFGAAVHWVASAMAQSWGAWGIPATVLAVAAFLIWMLLRSQERKDRGVVATILVFIAFNTLFWMAFEQAGSSLNLFAKQNTDRVVGGWEMPASWFQSVNAFLVIVLGPLFAVVWSKLGARGRDPKQATKIGMGLVLVGLGYVFMVVGAQHASTGVRVGMFWLLATYFTHTLGELCLSPTGLAFVTKAAPVKFVSLLMGIWFLSSFLAGVLGGYLAATTEAIEQGTTSLPWYPWFRIGGQADYYLLFVIASIALGAIALATSRFFSRILKDKA